MQKNIIRLFILSIILFVIVVFFFSLKENSTYDTKDLIGYELKKIELNHFHNDETITEEDLKKNNFTLINFWASWCGPCRIEHPILLKLKREKNLKILGVNFKDKKNNALEFLNSLGNPYDDLARDEFGKNSVNFGIYGIPESILIDKDLIVLKKFIGPISQNDYDFIKDVVKKK